MGKNMSGGWLVAVPESGRYELKPLAVKTDRADKVDLRQRRER